MIKQSKPIFLINKYRSILNASISVEMVCFLITLTDSLIAGNMIGQEPLIAVGTVAPLLPIEWFITSTINSGTLLFYNDHIGKYDKKNADSVFGQGLFLAVLAGILIIMGMLAGKEAYIGSLSLSDTVNQYTRDYYSLIIFYLAMDPLSCLLDNMLMSEGREKLSAAANISEILSNIVLSVLFVKLFGIRGIAFASILSKLLFFAIISKWSLKKMQNIELHLQPDLRICGKILSNGFAKASCGIFTALTEYALILYVTANFGQDTLTLLSVAIKIIGISGLFLGLSMAAQPFIPILCGEQNSWALRSLMKSVSLMLFMIGIALSLLTILFAPLLILTFGIEDPELVKQGTEMIRYMGLSFTFGLLTTFYFVYAFLMRKNGLAIFIGALNDFIAPVALSILGAMFFHDQTGLWIGLAIAPLISFAISMLVVLVMYGKNDFPWLIPKNRDKHTVCYDFDVTEENAAELSETLIMLLNERGCSQRTSQLAGMLVEDILMLIKEKNPSDKKLFAECNVIFEGSDVKVILRDSGIVFDVMSCDGTQSMHEYIVAQTLTLPEHKLYISTTGYNRNELLLIFSEKSGALDR